MFALVQFLLDKVKAIVSVKDIKNFDVTSFKPGLFKVHEVFWKPSDGEGARFCHAVVIFVAETKQFIELEQIKKRFRFPSSKTMQNLLEEAVKIDKKTTEKGRKNNKEIQEKQSVCEKENLNETLGPKQTENKRKSLSEDDDRPSTSKKQRRYLLSESESSEDELVLQSELKDLKLEYDKVVDNLKLKQEEICLLRNRNDELQELNISLQKQLLQMLNANSNVELNTAVMQKKPQNAEESNQVLTKPKKSVQNSGGNLIEKTPPSQNNITSSLQDQGSEESNLPSIKTEVIDVDCDSEFSNQDKTSNIKTEVIDVDCDSEFSNQDKPSNTKTVVIDVDCDSENVLKWEGEKMELAPGVFIQKDTWRKITSGKNMNSSRFVRNLAMSMWGSDTLRKRSVTGSVCKRFLKTRTIAKSPLTPVKINAVQNGLKLWLQAHEGKGEQEANKLSSITVVRKLLADKIMDLIKQQRKSAQTSVSVTQVPEGTKNVPAQRIITII